MARSGITKREVQAARLALLKAGHHPSIDAIRIHLGNTGSKSTISRLVKEIEDEEGGGGGQAPRTTVSEQLQTLVNNLAARLELESQERFDVLKEGHAAELKRLTEARDKALAESQASMRQAEARQAEAADAKAAALRVQGELNALRLEHAQTTGQLTTQVTALQEQLAAAKAHAAELGKQHEHAHQALEHFRAASKEQRDREARQHEQQLQYLQREVATATEALASKQGELRTALQEKVDALGLLTAARAERRQLDEQLRGLKTAGERLAVQNQLVDDLRAHVLQAVQQYETLQSRAEALERRNGELERLLAAAEAAAQTQADVVKGVLERIGQPPANKSKGKAASTG